MNSVLKSLSTEDLTNELNIAKARFEQLKAANLSLDITRGKPGTDQVALSNRLDGILNGDFIAHESKIDSRNYGNFDGLPEAKKLVAPLLGVLPTEVFIGGNSSLSLMYHTIAFATFFGVPNGIAPWGKGAKIIAIVPGYDRHFTLTAELGLELISVPMTAEGPDMDMVEELVKDPTVKGIWCVPKYSNPTGNTYSAKVVDRLAKLGKIATSDFRIIWDNAYEVHHLVQNGDQLTNIMELSRTYGTEDSVLIYGSMSKITFAGAAFAYTGMSPTNLKWFSKHMSMITVGDDKVNQLRHVRMFKDLSDIEMHMQQHAKIINPKFEAFYKVFDQELKDLSYATWTMPNGGYFISVDLINGCASKVVSLAASAGLKLTPAGATFPYGKDPEDKNVRIAPTYPPLTEVEQAAKLFAVCIKVVSLEEELGQR
jgi:aspartate/methionine/tyrosine aminotransferase